MFIDPHAHTSAISPCCRIPAPEVLKAAKAVGLDGISLMNHYQKSYIHTDDIYSYVQTYMDEIHDTQQLGAQMGMQVFWGVEVTMDLYPHVHMLIYGVEEDFLRRYPRVFDLTQQALYETVKASGGTLIQAHPFRGGAPLLDPAFMDGIEVNCHPIYGETHSARLLRHATQQGLIVSCGGDYHADTYRPRCGIHLPDTVTDSLALGKFFRETDKIDLVIHEINAPEPNLMTYIKPVRK